ncbi:unnamed protein product [Symbiodinium sp. CCMP2592]|nr:unnamed protein product [Symbiodinium sp. CCMP2592]
MQSFRAAFSKGLSALQNHQEQKQWVEAREVYEALSDAVDALLQLDVIGERHLKSLQSLKKTKLGGMSATRRSLIAREALKNGEFREALLLLVTSEEGKDLCDEIQDKLFEQNLSTTQDEGVLHERFSVLGAFLEAAGDNPPDELRETWQWVRQACSRAKPQIEATAQEKLMDTVSAASAADFVAFAASLLPLKKASCFLTPQQLLQAKQAVQSFLQHLTNIVEQVANEIQALDLQALRLSLGNVKLWLDTFQNLSGEEKEAVQDQLDLKLGLQAWISKSLADAMKGLMEPKAVLVAVETWDFREISVRCRVAAELDAVLKTGLIDMSHIEKYLAQRHDSAIHELENHTGSLKGFNAELKVLQNVTHELPECRAASHLVAQLGKALRENLLDRLSDNLRCARDVPAVVAASTELRQVAFDAPDTYEWVTSSLSAALHHLQNLAEFGVNGMHVCGSQLATTPIGKAIIGEHEDVFGAANEEERNISFRRAGETHDLNSIVSRLSDESGLGEDEKQWLEQALTAHESASKDLLEKYLYQTGACLDVARKQAKENLDMAVQQCKQDQNDDSTLAVIVHLSVCYTLVKSGSAFFLSAVQSQQDMLVIPHRAQILTVLRFLQVAHKTSKRKFWPAMFCRRGDKTNKRIYMNHLAQVQTGEGKCLTLGLLAALLAVNGIESDVVCYRQILTDQDHQAMLPFFEFLDIKDKIRYRTLDQLCSERLGDLTKASTELVEKQSVSVARHQLQLGHRALLLDEVDVLFSRKFYGHTWDGAFKLVSPQAQALVRFVFAEFSNGRLSSLMNITASKAFKELVGHYPPALHRALASVAVQLADNVQEWNKPEPFLDSSQSRIGYKDRDDVNYEICHANKTVFAYLNFEKTGKLAAEQVKPHVGIDLLCGRFSFADLPNMYSLILGVTGTLRELWDIPEFKDMLQKEYEINHFTYLPSIFGTSQLLFRPVEHVSVLKNEQDWMSRIAALASQESKAGNSVLVFFKNHRNLAKYPSWRKTECLTEQTDLKRRSGYIAAATASGQITLLTRAFGRGIDFQMPSDDGHTVVVIQTFLSSLISEERQLKGRTARQGKKGKFLQVLCAEELSAKMGFTEQDLETLTGGVESSILKILRDKQHEKTVAKMAGLVQRRKTSSVHEQQTRSFEKLVFRDDASVEDKLRKLASLNEQSANINIHYSVILDTSGSMAGRNQRQMNKAFNHFQKELCAQELKGSHIRASVILFETSAQVISQQTRPSDIPDISCHQAQGGTNFSRAFEACHTVMQESASDTHEFILFLTDGQAEFPETALNALLAAFEGRIKGLTCVAVGGDENTLPALQQIGHVFQARNIAFNLRDADDEATLVEVFGEVAASSRAIHLR